MNPPPEIPRYRIVKIIGSGRTGMVYHAQQVEGLHLHVAIKVIHRQLCYTEFDSRFEVERIALSRLNHPSIARVIEGGCTADGVPYLVTELIDGIPIDAFCNRHGLGVAARCRLLAQLADAVAYAHRHGIVHRDLKPANVLVTGTAEEPMPKIIDFGLAKMLDPPPEAVVETMVGAELGSPLYMAPEQIQSQGAIDTRADVYSLGILLYELLTGRHWIDLDRFEGLGRDQRRALLLQTPLVAASQRARDQETRDKLRGDLDLICATACSRDMETRYSSASDLAGDLRRHLAHQPLRARSPSLGYVARKAAERNRPLAATIALAGLLLITSIAGLVRSHHRAQRAESRARLEARQARELSDFLLGHFSGQDLETSSAVPPRSELDRAFQRLLDRRQTLSSTDTGLALKRLARAYQGLADYHRADELLARSIHAFWSESPADTALALETTIDRAILACHRGETALADSLIRGVLQSSFRGRRSAALESRAQQALGQSALVAGRYQEAIARLRQALSINRRVHGSRTDERSILIDLGAALNRVGRYAPAESILTSVLADLDAIPSRDRPLTARVLHNLGVSLSGQRRFEESLPLLDRAAKMQRKRRGGRELASTLNDLANVAWEIGDTTRALTLYLEALDLKKRSLGEDSPQLFSTLCSIGDIYGARREYDRARNTYRRAEAIVRKRYGSDYPQLAVSSYNLGSILQRAGDLDEALECARNAVRLDSLTYGADHAYVREDRKLVADIQRDRNRIDPDR